MPKVEIYAWQPGFEKVGHTKALQEFAGLGLNEAKSLTDRVLSGEVAAVEVETLEEAQLLADRLATMGAHARVRQDTF